MQHGKMLQKKALRVPADVSSTSTHSVAMLASQNKVEKEPEKKPVEKKEPPKPKPKPKEEKPGAQPG